MDENLTMTLDKYKERMRGSERYIMEKRMIHEHRNDIGRCPYCNANIKDRKVALYRELINALYRIYCWCGQERRHEFEMKDVKHLLGKNEYARFGDLVRFGGIVYKPKNDGKSEKALYGINMARAKQFFRGERDIPLQITLDQISGEIIDEIRGKVYDFPDLISLLNEKGMYDYEMPIQNHMV